MFHGILMPLITPFTEADQVDLPVYMDMIDGSLADGVHGFYLMASQGQGPTMTAEERVATMRAALTHIRRRVPVVVHVGTTHLSSTQALAREAEAAGADGIAVLPPYFYSDHTPQEVEAHFVGTAETSKLPMFMYENGKYTGIDVKPAWLARIADLVPTLAGVKLSYSSTMEIYAYLRQVPSRVGMFPGSITHVLPTYKLGIKGCIPPSGVLYPKLVVALWEACVACDWTLAMDLHVRLIKLQSIWARLHKEFGRSMAREALRLQGYGVQKFPRWANADLTEAGMQELQKFDQMLRDARAALVPDAIRRKSASAR
jgi:dihydrodipicolinate synthase/N-acetylneuraminate lyase